MAEKAEKTYRENLRLKRLLHNAKLDHQAATEDVDYRHPRGLNKQLVLELCTPEVDLRAPMRADHRPHRRGQSCLSCALGNLAVRSGYTVLYLRVSRWFETLLQPQGDGSHLKTLTRLTKVQLLILDDLLFSPLTDPTTH